MVREGVSGLRSAKRKKKSLIKFADRRKAVEPVLFYSLQAPGGMLSSANLEV